MMVDIPKIVQPLIDKYKDSTGKRLFNFYQYYGDEKTFNKAINCGLKEIGAILEVDDWNTMQPGTHGLLSLSTK